MLCGPRNGPEFRVDCNVRPAGRRPAWAGNARTVRLQVKHARIHDHRGSACAAALSWTNAKLSSRFVSARRPSEPHSTLVATPLQPPSANVTLTRVSRSATFPGVADGPATTPKPEPCHLSYAVLSLVAFVWFDELTFTCHAAPPQLIVEHPFPSRGCSPGVFPSTRRSSSLRHICKPGAASPSSPTFVRCASWATATQKIGEIKGQIRGQTRKRAVLSGTAVRNLNLILR